MTGQRPDAEMFLRARTEMIEAVKGVLSKHRPERNAAERVVTCTAAMVDEPHAVIRTQWPGWRDHVAPCIVDELLELMMPAENEAK